MKKALNKRLNSMLKDERIAPRDYSKLKKLLPEKEKKKITMIQKQEKNHFKTLQKIKRRLNKK